VSVFEAALRLLSPFMPFLTEELWRAVYDDDPPAKSIALTQYLTGNEHFDEVSKIDFGIIQSLIVESRALRKDLEIEEKAIVPVEIRIDPGMQTVIEENRLVIERLARVSEVRFVEQVTSGVRKRSTFNFDLALIYERKIDVEAERERLKKDIAKQVQIVANSDRQLNNPGFLAKAPVHIVEGLKKQHEEAQRLLDKLRGDLDSLSG
jgi:valyl-tRNA synthetase